MDALSAVIVGAAVGLCTGLVPGLHVNTLAAVAAAWFVVDPVLAYGLIAAGTVHTFVSILPATYLGAPAEDASLSMLPAHRMRADGRAPEAVRISVLASLLAACLVVVALLPYKWLLGEPGRLAPWLESTTPWILGGVLVLLVLQDRRRVAAVAVMTLAGVLGTLAWTWPTSNPWHVPSSPLLPLLTGLFAAPTLLVAMHERSTMPWQRPAPRRIRSLWSATSRGVGAAAFTAVLPGLTAATATAIAHPLGRLDERRIIATLSAVNTAHLGFALAMLWLLGRTRSGLADAARPALDTMAWTAGAPPVDLWGAIVVFLGAGVLGAAGTLALEPAFRRVARIGQPLHVGVLVVLIVLVALLTGPWGVALFAAATGVGLVPLAVGTRRVHLAACLIVPILWRSVE